MAQSSDKLNLSKPSLTGEISLEQHLAQRRSVREYPDTALSLTEVGQLEFVPDYFSRSYLPGSRLMNVRTWYGIGQLTCF